MTIRRGEDWGTPADVPPDVIEVRTDADAVVQVESRLFHAACAEAAFGGTAAWSHASPTTLSEWSRGHGWASSI